MSYLKYFLINRPSEVVSRLCGKPLNNLGTFSSYPWERMQNVSLGREKKKKKRKDVKGNVMPAFQKGKKKIGNEMPVSLPFIPGKIP